ncbi:SGNH/GDSL hydrolase family protein [Providencia sp. AGC89]
MTKYNTNNPPGSASPKDVNDNAITLDNLVNSTDITTKDRLGNDRLTIKGLEEAATSAGPTVEAAVKALEQANLAREATQTIEANSSEYVQRAESASNLSAESARESAIYADKASAVVSEIITDAKVFDTPDEGILKTINGEYFRVWKFADSGKSFIYYQNDNGAAKEITSTISDAGVISLITPNRLSNLFDDGGFKSGIAPRVKGEKSLLNGVLIKDNDAYLSSIGCEYRLRKPATDNYNRGLFCVMRIPDYAIGKYVIMSSIVISTDGVFGGNDNCSFLADENNANIISNINYINYRKDIDAKKRCYATCVKIPENAKYLHIGKGGLTSTDPISITSVFYAFSDAEVSIENIKWDAPYSISDAYKLQEDELNFNFEENLIRFGDLDGAGKNPLIRSGSVVVDLTTQRTLIQRGYTKAIKWRNGNEYIGITSEKVGEYVGGYFLVYAEDPRDIPSVKRAVVYTQIGTVLTEAEFIDGGMKEVGRHLFLFWGYFKVPPYSDITWLGSTAAPVTNERYATAFSLFSSNTQFDMWPIVRRLAQRNNAKQLFNQYVNKHQSNDNVEIISLVNSDKIVVLGDSYTESMHTLKDKSYAANVSMLTDWRIEPCGVSGNDCIMMNQRVIDNTPTFGWGIRDMGASHVMLMSQTNDARKRSVSYKYWQNDLQRVIQSILAIGAKPIISTEHPRIDSFGYASIFNAARNAGADFFDIASNAHHFEFNTEPKLWSGTHPGTRTNSVIWNGVLNHLNHYPRPRTSIKLFRARNSADLLSQLLYDNIAERAEIYKEITLGHSAIHDKDAQYFDDVSALNAKDTSRTRYNSEYGNIVKGQPLHAVKYLLAEVVLPAFASDIQSLKVVIDASSHELYAINRLTQPAFTQTLYKTFISNESNVVIGDKYTDSVREFTVVGKVGDKIVCSPNRDPKDSSGTLTKISGSGAASLSYTRVEQGFDPNYYSHFDDKKGVWEKVQTELTGEELSKYMQGDKLSLLLVSSSTLTLSDIKFEYIGGDNKPVAVNRQHPIGSTELLLNTKFDAALTGWEVTGDITAYRPDQGNPPLGISHVVAIGAGKSISQLFTVPGLSQGGLLQFRVWCRRKVPLFSSSSDFSTSSITSDSFDFRKLSLYVGGISTELNKSTELNQLVGLGWQEVIFDYYHVGSGAIELKMTLQSSDDIEIAFVGLSV